MKRDNVTPETPTQLRNPWLLIARVIWFALVILALATWGAGLSPYFNEVRMPCAEEECLPMTLSPQEAGTLRDAGLSLELYAGYLVGGEILSAASFILFSS